MIDNHIHHGNELGFDVRRITWRRVLDMNDRALRDITVALGGPGNGFPREDGFDIVVASEVMAIFCLATSLKDLKERLGKIVVGYTRDQKPDSRARHQSARRDDGAAEGRAAPNLVQTLENNPAFIHGGPFANIAHGCNSVMATQTALKLADYVVTEAGFGADLGAEKFVDIKCRKAGLRPDAAVIVATMRALKYHGGVEVKELGKENLEALEKGIANLERHIHNVRNQYGLPCVVAINHAPRTPTRRSSCCRRGWRTTGEDHRRQALGRGRQGRAGARAQGRSRCARVPNDFRFVYEDEDSLWDKMKTIATQIYGASTSSRTARCARRSRSCRTRATGTTRCAWRRRSTRSRPTPNCAARRRATWSTSAKCGSRPAPNSS